MRDFIVKIFVKLGLYQSAVRVINYIKFEIQAHHMKHDGLAMLSRADQTFSSMGVQAFLTFGVLLGAYRDHGFISYDPDIDLGILADQVPNNLHQIMEDAGFRLRCQNVLAESGTIMEESYAYKQIHLDIFYYYKDGKDFYCYIPRKHETKEWKEANATDGFPCDRSYVPACEMERREFLGLQIWMPKDTDGWLRAIYSDSYMTPIKNWDLKDGYVTRIMHTKERCYRKYPNK